MRRWILAVMGVVAVLSVACGGGSSSTSDASGAEATAPTGPTTPTETSAPVQSERELAIAYVSAIQPVMELVAGGIRDVGLAAPSNRTGVKATVASLMELWDAIDPSFLFQSCHSRVEDALQREFEAASLFNEDPTQPVAGSALVEIRRQFPELWQLAHDECRRAYTSELPDSTWPFEAHFTRISRTIDTSPTPTPFPVVPTALPAITPEPIPGVRSDVLAYMERFNFLTEISTTQTQSQTDLYEQGDFTSSEAVDTIRRIQGDWLSIRDLWDTVSPPPEFESAHTAFVTGIEAVAQQASRWLEAYRFAAPSTTTLIELLNGSSQAANIAAGWSGIAQEEFDKASAQLLGTVPESPRGNDVATVEVGDATVQAAVQATQEAMAPAPRVATTVKEFTGTGAQTTRPFTVDDGWEIQWDASGDIFQIYVYTGGGDLSGIAANQLGTGSGAAFQPNGGAYYLQMNAMGNWTVRVVQLP